MAERSAGAGSGPIEYRVRPPVSETAMNALFAAAWPGYEPRVFAAVLDRSLTWVGACVGDALVGFVNVAWDGGSHAFLLDTTVHPDHWRRGVGSELVRRAIAASREAGAEWLHVDYEPHLEGFYRGCGFRHTTAGLVQLQVPPGNR